MINWERNAARCQDEYGSYVNFEERDFTFVHSAASLYMKRIGLRLILVTSFALFVRMRMNIN